MLVELNAVEQRLKAVLEGLDGASVTDVARRYEVTRQSVHNWLRRHAADGFKGLVDQPSRPLSCPHQMPREVEAMVVEWRRADGGLGRVSIVNRLREARVVSSPGRSSAYRCFVRHNLVVPVARKRKREDYIRWERSPDTPMGRGDGAVKSRRSRIRRLLPGNRPRVVRASS